MTSPLSQRHLFVVGFFRSGTSLIYNFLNLHPQIKLLYEADLLKYSLVGISSLSGHNWWDRLDFYNSTCQRHGLAVQPAWKKVFSTKEAAEILYRQYAGSECRYIGEKSPSYYNWLPELARLFPDARFIVIWRNPQDVISSILSAGPKDYFFLNRSLPLRSVLGLEQMQVDVLALRSREVPILDLCYEDLVENPELWLKSICAFLELPFDPGMLRLENADLSMFPPGEHHAKAKSSHVLRVDQPPEPYRDSLDLNVRGYLSRWKERFGNQLATRRYWSETGGNVPTWTELFRDRFEYSFAQIYSERLTPLIYGLCPYPWLRFYRSYRRKRFTSSLARDVRAAHPLGNSPLKISVVTPSYKQLPWLRLCAASVADQEGVTVEHIIQDAQSGPDLEEWVRQNTRAQLYVEADSGMYDAINRGFARATGDIVCWLNSDEQYLEGTLAKVARFFETHPKIDVLFGDALLISNTGAVLSYRRTVAPNLRHIQLSHLNILSCATFVRRSILERGYVLDTHWRAVADAVWVVELLKAGIPMAVLNEPLAVFTITDSNLGQTSLAKSEAKIWQEETSSASRWLRPYFVLWHRLTKLLSGAYWPRSVSTHLYTLASPQKRVSREARHVGFRWPKAG